MVLAASLEFTFVWRQLDDLQRRLQLRFAWYTGVAGKIQLHLQRGSVLPLYA